LSVCTYICQRESSKNGITTTIIFYIQVTKVSSLQDEPENSHDTFTRQISGALAQFGDGASIEKISLSSDFSAVHLTELPTSSTPASVSGMMAQMGFAVPANCIRIRVSRDTSTSTSTSADIRLEDASFAKSFCDTLSQRRASLPAHMQAIKAEPVVTQRGSAVDCRKVHCSWHKPTQVVWLNFGNEDIARKVGERFGAGVYRILGQRVASKDVKGSSTGGRVRGRGGGFRNPQAWTVMLTDVAARATERDITKDIPAAIRPRNVKRSTAADTKVGVAEASVMVKSMLEQIGPLEWWEDAVETTAGKRKKTKARFKTEDDAREAVAALNGKELPFNVADKLTVQLVYSTKFKVSTRIADAVQSEIELQNQAVWKAQHLVYIAYAPAQTQGYKVLKIEGEVSKEVGQAKNTLEKILEGEIVMHEEKILWAPCFGTKYHSMIQTIETTLGVVVARNKRLRRLHLYGPREKRDRARMQLIDLAKEDASAERAIHLDPKQFSWACRGGFRAICHALGDGIATFDVISAPKRIVITGSDEDFKLALSMVTDTEDAINLTFLRLQHGGNDCTICWTDAEHPVRTRCNHIYCADCFEGLCFSAVTTGKNGIQCAGDSGKCTTVFPLDELQEHLSSKAFEDLLKACFASYIQQHPTDFRYCPTPDCGQIYRVATTQTATAFTCTACLESVCASCHASHARMTCAEYKDHASGGYEAYERAKKELGIKDCPKCSTAIEKTDGCNHMTCGGCGIHICWRCMKTFADSGPCYAHMNEVHGGIMDVEYY
jgi:IBR domain, a half RING-finger domain